MERTGDQFLFIGLVMIVTILYLPPFILLHFLMWDCSFSVSCLGLILLLCFPRCKKHWCGQTPIGCCYASEMLSSPLKTMVTIQYTTIAFAYPRPKDDKNSLSHYLFLRASFLPDQQCEQQSQLSNVSNNTHLLST